MRESSPAARPWLRFKLRTLLVAWLVGGAWLGWWIHSARQQRDAISKIRQLRNSVDIAYSFEVGYSNDKHRPHIDPKALSWIPDFVLEALGKDFFYDVVHAKVYGREELEPELATQLGRLKDLKNLILMCDVTDAALTRLAGLRQLRSLQIYSSSSNDALRTISQLPKLEAVVINWGDFTDEGFAHLARLRSLKSLTLDHMTDDGLAHLARTGNLEELYILPGQWDRLDEVTGSGLAHLATCCKLRELTLKRSCLTDDELRYLADLASLERLSLELGNITGVGFQHLTGLSNLKWVCLENTPITDEAITFLAQLPHLEAIDLRGTEVTIAGFEQLAGAPVLRKLVVTPPANTKLEQVLDHFSPFMKYLLGAEIEMTYLNPGDMERLAAVLPRCQIVSYRDF